MPVIRTECGILYFAHVPKCAGTAVERYLVQRFGQDALALHDPRYMARPEHQRWSRTSPQHIEVESLARLFPDVFFVHMFAVVRHPAVRLRSAYLHQRDIEERIDPDEGFSDWLRALPERRAENPWYLDNHTRPMADLVPENCVIFQLEEGLGRVVDWLDGVMGHRAGPDSIAMVNNYVKRLAHAGKRPRGENVEITAEDLVFIHEIDRGDFERFGYPMVPLKQEPKA